MDPSEKRYLEDDDTAAMKTIKAATTGLVAGTIWGTVVATWHDVPRVERNVALPGLLRTLKMMGNYGLTFAAIGGVYIGVEQLVQHYRMKRDFVNGAVGGFAAGAAVLGFKEEQQIEESGDMKLPDPLVSVAFELISISGEPDRAKVPIEGSPNVGVADLMSSKVIQIVVHPDPWSNNHLSSRSKGNREIQGVPLQIEEPLVQFSSPSDPKKCVELSSSDPLNLDVFTKGSTNEALDLDPWPPPSSSQMLAIQPPLVFLSKLKHYYSRSFFVLFKSKPVMHDPLRPPLCGHFLFANLFNCGMTMQLKVEGLHLCRRSHCGAVVQPPSLPPPSSPPSVFFILDSTYLCLGDTSMSYTSSLVIVARQLGKMTMIERHASRGDGVVLITAQHSRYFSSISELDNLAFKRQAHMNKDSFEDHLQTSTLPTRLVGSINFRDDILAFLVAFHLVTPSCLKEARAAVVCVGPDGSGTYIDVAFQAFDDMLLRVLECLTALVLHTKLKFWTKLAGCLALMGTMQFGGTFVVSLELLLHSSQLVLLTAGLPLVENNSSTFVGQEEGRSIPTALSAGAALAFTSAVLDVGGQTTRIDTGKEYYPYTTEKRTTSAN
ncbi:hypothetical protein Syun_014800 [Stephania yunnanensis]|uniref:Uncharacterized protein n=1 Tax=Stephania yunnanensis TaxID=152371 RepID=A0AAP0JKW1_9MAGN